MSSAISTDGNDTKLAFIALFNDTLYNIDISDMPLYKPIEYDRSTR